MKRIPGTIPKYIIANIYIKFVYIYIYREREREDFHNEKTDYIFENIFRKCISTYVFINPF